MTPYAVLPDECGFVDQQTLKLQEVPEAVPTGEMPRSILCAVERKLVDQAPPGTHFSLLVLFIFVDLGYSIHGEFGS